MSSSHQPNKKSRAMSLNHGVKEFSNERPSQVTDDVLQSQVLTGVFEHSLKLFLAHVFVIPDFIGVRGHGNIRREEQNVIDWIRESVQPT